ncbi:hypothetical protein RRG08_010176 [Elysia crispata]|uniref:HAT C-terminal dimerisation domain-containing protein n=1 Tax=Elysia crispata TaxID=231223 RepID=A0AAE1DZX9_9GAST|nr:hypothetical protein RRG08_010176 [Elysia crispata]
MNESFLNFNKLSDRLDCLSYNSMNNQPQYAKAWTIVKDLLLLSHGQASVERGFSINKECSDVNLSEKSLVARRQIKDHFNSIGDLKNMVISKSCLLLLVGPGRNTTST